jgi:hypothetical protein
LTLIINRITPATLNENLTFADVVDLMLRLSKSINIPREDKNIGRPVGTEQRYLQRQTPMQERLILYLRLCGRVRKAEKAVEFYHESRANGVKFSPLVYTFALYGTRQDPDVFPAFSRTVLGDMAAEGYRPDIQTYMTLLVGASNSCDIESASHYFRQIETEYGTC